MSVYIKHEGAWRIPVSYAKDGGSWKISTSYAKHENVWTVAGFQFTNTINGDYIANPSGPSLFGYASWASALHPTNSAPNIGSNDPGTLPLPPIETGPGFPDYAAYLISAAEYVTGDFTVSVHGWADVGGSPRVPRWPLDILFVEKDGGLIVELAAVDAVLSARHDPAGLYEYVWTWPDANVLWTGAGTRQIGWWVEP